MRQRYSRAILTALLLVLPFGVACATRNNVPIPTITGPFQSVSGTVTVRLDGVLVDAQSVGYVISPNFRANAGALLRTEWGTYFLNVNNVPMDQNYTLTITASYNDSIAGRDGVIEQKGRSYTGQVKVEIPYHRDVDFGVRFIDLRP
jgi:hypothetical protein